MTMILVDGFDMVDAVDVWTAVNGNSAQTTTKRTGTHGMGMGIGQIMYRALAAAEQDDGVTLGTGVLLGSTNLDAVRVMGHHFSEVGGATHISVNVYPPARSIRIYRDTINGSGVLLAESPPNIVTYDAWHYVETQVKIADAGGSVEVRLDGSAVLTYAGDTRNGGAGIVSAIGIIGNNFSAHNCTFDDVYMLNEQGPAPWNTFLGDTRCYPLYPMGNGFYAMLVGSDGNSVDNWLLVDETGAPVTTDYLQSVTPGDKDSFLLQDLSSFQSLGTISAVETRLHAAKSETGTKRMRAFFRQGGADQVGADHVVAWLTYSTYRDIFQVNPATAAAWTIAEVDAVELGAEVRA